MADGNKHLITLINKNIKHDSVTIKQIDFIRIIKVK